MPQEIEHKYLVRKDLWYAVHKPAGMRILQGYLLADPEKTIRIRIAGTKGFFAIKGPSQNASRAEYEYSIPIADAEELLQLCLKPLIEKVRFRIEYFGKNWDVDEFFGKNEGLILAEIELTYEGETYKKPTWVGEEVTDDKRYYNSYLAVNPISTWK